MDRTRAAFPLSSPASSPCSPRPWLWHNVGVPPLLRDATQFLGNKMVELSCLCVCSPLLACAFLVSLAHSPPSLVWDTLLPLAIDLCR